MATDERYATNAARGRNRTDVLAAVEPWLAVHTTKEVVDSFGGTVPIGPVNTAADIFVDPHVAARGMLVPVEQPGSDEPVTVAGEPIKFTATPSRVNGRGPSVRRAPRRRHHRRLVYRVHRMMHRPRKIQILNTHPSGSPPATVAGHYQRRDGPRRRARPGTASEPASALGASSMRAIVRSAISSGISAPSARYHSTE
jgi:hypothetical protein